MAAHGKSFDRVMGRSRGRLGGERAQVVEGGRPECRQGNVDKEEKRCEKRATLSHRQSAPGETIAYVINAASIQRANRS